MKRLAFVAALLCAGPALAHHPLEGAPMTGAADGLLSGLAHPVLAADHLAFVLAVGIASARLGWLWAGPLAYLGAMLAGVAVTAAGVDLPLREAAIAASLAVLGVLVARRAVRGRVLLPVMAGFGLFHGAGFGGAMAGTEAAWPMVLAGYLAGLGSVQYAIALAVGWLALRAPLLRVRMAGAAIAGAGALLIFDRVEPALIGLVTG
jgi:urease accessory protein